MVGFVIIVVLFIYLFQVNFLDDFYKFNKIKEMEEVEKSLKIALETGDARKIIENTQLSSEVCVRIETGSAILQGYGQNGACALATLDDEDLNYIYQKTKSENNEYLFQNFSLNIPDIASDEYYILSSIADVNNYNVLVMVGSLITPVNATTSTLRSLLTFVALFVIIAAIVLAFILSRFMVRPLSKIRKEAINLPNGTYDGSNLGSKIREYQELNETMIASSDKINEATKARKELLANVSHDLRTPLTMIVGYGEMMRDFDDEKNNANIEVIISEAKRLSSLVDDLLDLSKNEEGKIKLAMQAVSINQLLDEVATQYRKYMENAKIEFKLKLLDKDVSFQLDEKRIKQVLYNFLNNAINYNHDPQPYVELGAVFKDDKYEIYVYDNGEGIKEEDLDKIWDRYYRIGEEHQRQMIGSGIGLSLSRSILKAHHLSYGVSSKYKEYSRFYFVLDKSRAVKTAQKEDGAF